jgi:hypothetical protein
MAQQDELQGHSYPTGRGYGHDYMRGGEVLGGYGYSERPEYGMRRGELGDGSGRSAQASPQEVRRTDAAAAEAPDQS